MPVYFRSTPVNEPFAFDSIGNHWRQGMVCRPRGYPLYHYLQTEHGRGRIEVKNQTYILNEGEGLLIAPFISHSYLGETDEWFTSFATFTGTAESTIPHILKNRSIIFTDREQGKQISSIISDVVQQYAAPPLNARSLSIDCYSLLMHFVDGIYTSDLKNDPPYERYILPSIKEIETNYHSKLTVQELSQKVFVTPQYLSRLFGRFLGCSAYEYLTSFRISKARELLITHPRMEIQNVAHRTGFEDASHFIAMFKKKTGTTPKEFRVLYRLRE